MPIAREIRGTEDSLRARLEVDAGGALTVDDFDTLRQDVGNQIKAKFRALPADVLRSERLYEHVDDAKSIDEVDLRYLPSSLPFRTKVVKAEDRQVPSALHAKVRLEISGQERLSSSGDSETGGHYFAGNTADLAGKRLTISYSRASPADAEIVDAYNGMLDTPAYAIELRPVVRADGAVVAVGESFSNPGTQQRFEITYTEPGVAPQKVENPITVGSITALTLDLGKMTTKQFSSQVEKVREATKGATPQNVFRRADWSDPCAEGYSVLFRNGHSQRRPSPEQG